MPVPVSGLERQLGQPSLRRISPYNPEPGLSKRGLGELVEDASPPLESLLPTRRQQRHAPALPADPGWRAGLRSWNTKSRARMVTPKNRISRMLTETSSRVLSERGCIVLAAQLPSGGGRVALEREAGNPGHAASRSA